MHKVDLSNPLIYGYGSVTNTIVSCLKDLNCNNISLTGRDKEKAKKFIKHNLQKLNSNQKYSVLINCNSSTTKEEVFNILSYCDSLIDLNVTKNLNDLVLEAKKKIINCLFQVVTCQFTNYKNNSKYILAKVLILNY